MMASPYWLWYPGDFEIHHALKLNCRREEHHYMRPTIWRLDDCWHNVRFRFKVHLEKPETITANCNGIGNITIGSQLYAYGTEIHIEPGDYTIIALAAKTDGLPCVYIQGDTIQSGPGWEADNCTGNWLPAGYSDDYKDIQHNPEVFHFCYKPIQPVSEEPIGNGKLYDFGREVFAKLCFSKLKGGKLLGIYYGESREEAMDIPDCYLTDTLPDVTGSYTMPARAFRYVYIPDNTREFQLTGEFEYLPLEWNGEFTSADNRLNQIWQTSAYTFHLNSREFFLDGIKRDRWVWSGDAYQSYLINYYLFFDHDLVKRTSTALRGKDPMEQHINTILDYSLYWVIALSDYYRYTGDIKYLEFIWLRLKSLIAFCLDKRNEDGFIVGGKNDWVFIDWHEPMDKTGAVCAEQMLFIKALEAAADCAKLLGCPDEEYRRLAVDLHKRVNDSFWMEEKGAYIDSYASGKNNVTRHANLFALLFDIADKEQQKKIISNVLLNDDIPPITTPYFKFYELEALCKTGNQSIALQIMKDYWGGMLDLGATSIWEEYDPKLSGTEHYAMYGGKYHKSLCHAWGASPIYLLGRYFLGVQPASPGYQTFICAPESCGLSWMEGCVPIQDGNVKITLRDNRLCVVASRDGGTLIWKGEKYPLQAGKPIEIDSKA